MNSKSGVGGGGGYADVLFIYFCKGIFKLMYNALYLSSALEKLMLCGSIIMKNVGEECSL